MSEKKGLQQSHRPSFGIRMRTLFAILIVWVTTPLFLRIIGKTHKSAKHEKKQQHPFKEFWKDEASNFTDAFFRVGSIIFTLLFVAWWIIGVYYVCLFLIWLDRELSPITWAFAKNIFLYYFLTAFYSLAAMVLWFVLWFIIAAVAILFGKTIRIPLSIRFIKDRKKDENH